MVYQAGLKYYKNRDKVSTQRFMCLYKNLNYLRMNAEDFDLGKLFDFAEHLERKLQEFK